MEGRSCSSAPARPVGEPVDAHDRPGPLVLARVVVPRPVPLEPDLLLAEVGRRPRGERARAEREPAAALERPVVRDRARQPARADEREAGACGRGDDPAVAGTRVAVEQARAQRALVARPVPPDGPFAERCRATRPRSTPPDAAPASALA